MALGINDNLFNKSPKADNDKTGVFQSGIWRPYNNIAEALASPKLISAYRSVGLTINILKDSSNTEYWFRDGIDDLDLIEKIPDTIPSIPDYDPAFEYNTDNVVVFGDNKGIYRSTVDDNIGVDPTASNPWELTSETIPDEWTGVPIYNTGNYVLYDVTDVTIIAKSLQDNNGDHNPMGMDGWWEIISIYQGIYDNSTIYELYGGVYKPSVNYNGKLYTAELSGSETVTDVAPDTVSTWEKLSNIEIGSGLRLEGGTLKLGSKIPIMIDGAILEPTALNQYHSLPMDVQNMSSLLLNNTYLNLAYNTQSTSRGGSLNFTEGEVLLSKLKGDNNVAGAYGVGHYWGGDSNNYTTRHILQIDGSITEGMTLTKSVVSGNVIFTNVFRNSFNDLTLYEDTSLSTFSLNTFTPTLLGDNSYYGITARANKSNRSSSSLNYFRIRTDNATYGRGLEYEHDYSANYTARSLVDKAYADAGINNLTFSNGLNRVANAVKLGGNMSSNVSINRGTFGFSIFPSNNLGGSMSLGGTVASLGYTRTPLASVQAITLSDSGMIVSDSRITEDGKGLEYAADYSTYFTSRSLVDKGYVDAAVSGVPIGSYQLLSQKGAANGYAQLDSGAKIPLSILPDSILGQVEYQGTWNATTNSPTLVSPPASNTKGHYYIASVAGTQFGISFEVGDWIISNGTAWAKVDNSDAVTTVFGRLGNILAIEADYSAFYPVLSGAYVNPSWLTSIPFSKLTATPTTLAGYGITDLNTQARLAISETITGIDYNSTTGVFSLTAGYEIPTTNTYLPLTGGTLTGNLSISKAVGTDKTLLFQTSGSSRWNIQTTSSSESGSNVGSNFAITRYSDAGSIIDNPFQIIRSTGATIVGISLQVPKIGIGITPQPAVNNYNSANITGAVSAFGNYTNAIIQSDVTTSAYGHRTAIGTQATSFILPTLHHYAANQGTFGAGSSVTTQIGFNAESSLIGATNNYGFYGALAAASGRLNFYAAGTAINAFMGATLFGSAAISAGALAQLTLTPNADATKGLIIRGFSPTQSANLFEVQGSTGTILNQINSTGTFFGRGFSNIGSTSNALIDLHPNGAVISRNIADTSPALIVNNLLGTNYIQTWLQNSSIVGGVSSVGFFNGAGMSNLATGNNSTLTLGANGSLISRNISDANPALKVSLSHPSSTGDIVQFISSISVVASVDKAGRHFIKDSSAPSTPTGGGIIYVESGALKYIGSSGTVTVICPA